MALKGQATKQEMMQDIIKLFPDSFINDKEIRVNMEENGVPIQIKITLTVVKTPISNSPENHIVHEEQFLITDDEKIELENTLKEIGVSF